MTHKADQLALKAVLVLGIVTALYCWFRSWAANRPQISLAEIESLVSRAVITPAPTPVAVSDERAEKARKRAVETLAANMPKPTPEIRRAIPVEKPPTPYPRQIVVNIPSKRWSEAIKVPPGKNASFAFSLGRIGIERNGEDLGQFYREPLVRVRKTGPDSYSASVNPFTSVNKMPRTIHLDPDTRSFRLRSYEKAAEDVIVEFSD